MSVGGLKWRYLQQIRKTGDEIKNKQTNNSSGTTVYETEIAEVTQEQK